MVIFYKNLNSIEDVKDNFKKTCPFVELEIDKIYNCDNTINLFNNLNSYIDWVDWAIDVCENNTPSPFSVDYPNACINLTVGNNFFTIKLKSGFGLGIKVDTIKGNISYEASIVFYSDENFIKYTNEYNMMRRNGWDIKSKEWHKSKGNKSKSN